MSAQYDPSQDVRIVQRAVAFWKNGYHGWHPTYQQALALITMRLAIYDGAYADDRMPATEEPA